MKSCQQVIFPLAAALLLFSCKKDDPTAVDPKLIVRFAFDPNQERLNNIGEPEGVPNGHAAQTPDFNSISAHYLEMNATKWQQIGEGEVLYTGPETTAGGAQAINFQQAKVVSAGQDFFTIPLKDVAAGDYDWMRVSLSYQNYDIDYLSSFGQLSGTIASFIGYNNYITEYTVNEESIVVNGNRLQGYWGFETVGVTVDGQAPEGATTVPNPIFDTSPIPAGSCLVTGQFASTLTITGNETEDIIITLSLSNNNSFEWVDLTEDGLFEPEAGETVVDMGIRGLIPKVN
mgnify:CR=1 FL=1|jgi:hypothetical protein